MFKWFWTIFSLGAPVFQTKQALVFKAMYQSAFLARKKVLNFDGWLIKRFWVNNIENFFKNLLLIKSRTIQLKW